MTFINISKESVLRKRKFILGISVGAILLLLVSAIVVVLLKVEDSTSADNSHWSYDNQDQWGGLCQTGELQSPIALSKYRANKTDIPTLYLDNIGYYDQVEVGNDGHTVTVRFDTYNSKPTLSGAGLTGNFTLDNLHFHWPSEHTINRLQYALEAHFVFYSDNYDNLTQALEYPNAVSVVGILFSIVDETPHTNFQVIDEAVKKVSENPGTSTNTSTGITLSDFFPSGENFFQYTGSLTTPSCTENINWFVFEDPSYIDEDELEELVEIYTTEGKLLESNNRKLQNRNGRSIYLQA